MAGGVPCELGASRAGSLMSKKASGAAEATTALRLARVAKSLPGVSRHNGEGRGTGGG